MVFGENMVFDENIIFGKNMVFNEEKKLCDTMVLGKNMFFFGENMVFNENMLFVISILILLQSIPYTKG